MFTIDLRVTLWIIVATGVYALLLKFLPKNSPHDVQTKGGGRGVKGLLNNVKKTALFPRDGFPYCQTLSFKVDLGEGRSSWLFNSILAVSFLLCRSAIIRWLNFDDSSDYDQEKKDSLCIWGLWIPDMVWWCGWQVATTLPYYNILHITPLTDYK